MRFYLPFLILIFVVIGCSNAQKTSINNKKVLPKTLDESIAYFKKEVPASELNDFKNQNERDASADWHMSKGLWMRNNWIRGSRDTALVEYFHHLGISNPDDISGIIITSLYRNLNNKDIDLKSQISFYTAYWKKISDCEQEVTKIAVNQYNWRGINSKITIIMWVDTANKHRNAETFMCPNPAWTFDPKKDLKITGAIIEKYNINSKDNVFFKIRIDNMNYPNTEILSQKVKIGDVVNFSLKNLTILN